MISMRVVAILLMFSLLWSSLHLLKSEGCPPQEKAALLTLKASLEHSNCTPPKSWDEAVDCCAWERVMCSNTSTSTSTSSRRVTALYLSDLDYYFTGSVRYAMEWQLNFALFKSFRALRYLDLSNNLINGSLASQDFTALKKLTYLDLSYNEFTGEIPTSLTAMPSLQVLNLSFNGLRGSLEVFMGLQHLRYIDLSKNSLKGKIPQHAFSGLTSLQHIDLSENLLDGSIPTGVFSNLSSLQYVDLSDNLLGGHIPPQAFSNLTSLESLDLSYNLFHGNFPLPSLANLSKLQEISLSDNTDLGLETNFQQSVASFQLRLLALSNCNLNTNFLTDGAFLSSQHNLEVIDISNNNMFGSLPDWFLKNFTRLVYVSLRNNTLAGQIHLPTKTIASLKVIDLSNNHIGGFLPSNFGLIFPNLHYLDLSMNHLVGCMPSSFQNISELGIVILRRNHFRGHIQPHVCGLRQLQVLDLSQNKFSGTLPSCSTPLDLVYLNLGGNDFRGSFSDSFVGTTRLELLDVGNNKFSGPMPGWFGNLVFTRILLLGENNFEGSIPTQLCKMQRLQLLDLHKNKLSGNIPPCLGNMMFMKKTEEDFVEHFLGLLDAYINTSSLNKSYGSFRAVDISHVLDLEEVVLLTKRNSYPYHGKVLAWMTGIDLSSNRLTGGIPSDIGNLARIKFLNFSNNHLTGPIPESFSRFKDVESLDLSHNNLSGAIPRQLSSQLKFLEVFSVAYNNFSGCTPEFKYQFGTFGVESYEGNAGLHGPPLTNSCFLDYSPQNVQQKAEEGRCSVALNDIIFYGMMAVTSVLFFWVTVAVLHLNPTGQRICSTIADRCVDVTNKWVSCFQRCGRIKGTSLHGSLLPDDGGIYVFMEETPPFDVQI